MNYIVNINGVDVEISPKVYKRIESVARDRKISIPEAISFCLQKVN